MAHKRTEPIGVGVGGIFAPAVPLFVDHRLIDGDVVYEIA